MEKIIAFAYVKYTERLKLGCAYKMKDSTNNSSILIDSGIETVWNAITEEGNGIRVTINSEGFQQSMANLKAMVERKEIPYA